MSRCVEFTEKISAEILAAYLKSMTKYRLVCERTDGTKIAGTLQRCKPDGLQRLAAALNRKFSRRRYYVESVKIYELPIIRKVA